MTNLAIAFQRQSTRPPYFGVLVVDALGEFALLGNATTYAPLYVQGQMNFDDEKLKLLFSDCGDIDVIPEPDDILAYIYASMHSPTYRLEYKEFLRSDYPKIRKPSSWKEFHRLAEIGDRLISLHLMKSEHPNRICVVGSVGDVSVRYAKHSGNAVRINESQVLEGVSATAWNFYIGSHQPARRWLKVRKGRRLTSEEILIYSDVVTVLEMTHMLMNEIDQTRCDCELCRPVEVAA